MVFPKSLALWITALALLFAAALLIFVYFQGGSSHAIRSSIVLIPSEGVRRWCQELLRNRKKGGFDCKSRIRS